MVLKLECPHTTVYYPNYFVIDIFPQLKFINLVKGSLGKLLQVYCPRLNSTKVPELGSSNPMVFVVWSPCDIITSNND